MKAWKGKIPKSNFVPFTPPPAPVWSMEVGKPALQTLYADHYYRIMAVVAAAKSGDRILLKLALDNYDAKGCEPEATA